MLCIGINFIIFLCLFMCFRQQLGETESGAAKYYLKLEMTHWFLLQLHISLVSFHQASDCGISHGIVFAGCSVYTLLQRINPLVHLYIWYLLTVKLLSPVLETRDRKNKYMWASLVFQRIKNLPAMWETWVWSLGWEDPLEEGMETHSSILAWRIPMDRRTWWAAVHGVTKSRTWLSK